MRHVRGLSMMVCLLLLGLGVASAHGRVYPASEAHAPPSCGPERDSCRRIRFVVHGGAGNAAVSANLALARSPPQTQVSAVTNGHHGDARVVIASNHTLHLRPGINTILYTFPAPVSIRELRINRNRDVPDDADFVTYEAEDATCSGAVIGPNWETELGNATDIASEASQRKACHLTEEGQFVELVLSKPGNLVELRFSIPDDTETAVEVASDGDGTSPFSLALTANYSWNYGWQISPSSRDPSKGYAHKFYDEVTAELVPLDSQRVLPAGTKVRFTLRDAAVPITIDCADVYNVPAPLPRPASFVSVLDHGADPSGANNSVNAFLAAMSQAAKAGSAVWIPPGRYLCPSAMKLPSNMTVRGAGPFYSTLIGTPTDSKTTMTIGPMLSGNRALNVTVLDLAIEGQSTMRMDGAYVAVSGSFGGGSLFQNLRIRHTNAGCWIAGYNDTSEGSAFSDLHWVGMSVHNTFADGITHHAFSGVTIESSHIRYSGDDGMAMWSGTDAATTDTDFAFRNNHISLNTQGSGISIYGGHNHTVTGNTIVDNLYNGCGVHICNGRFSPVPLGKIRVIGNTIIRGGSRAGHGGAQDPELLHGGKGALCFLSAGNSSWSATDVVVQGLTIRDSHWSAIQFEGPQFIEGVAVSDVAIQGAAMFGLVLEANGHVSFKNVTAERLGFGATYYCPQAHGTFAIDEVGAGPSGAWWNETRCAWPPLGV